MITITLYDERSDSIVAKSTFTSEISTASNNWKAFAKRNHLNENLQIIQSGEFMLLAFPHTNIRQLDIKCDEYPYDITPIIFNDIHSFNNKHCCVLSQKNVYHYPIDEIYMTKVSPESIDNNYSLFSFIFDNPLLTYATMFNATYRFNNCSINGNEITVEIDASDWIFTLTPKYQNMFTINYLPSIQTTVISKIDDIKTGTYTLTFDITKPYVDNVVITVNNEKITVTPSNESVNIEEGKKNIFGDGIDYISKMKTYINQIVKTQEFKDCYNNLIKTTNFEQFVQQFINNFPIDNCTLTNAILYTCSCYMNIRTNDFVSFIRWIMNNESYIHDKIFANEDFMECWNSIIDMFFGPRNSNALGFIVYYVVNYIANNTCTNVLDYLLDFINGIPDTTNQIKHVSCDVTPFIVDIPTQNVTIKTPKISEGTSQPPKEDKNTEEESSNIIWIILAIVAVVVIVVIILFVSKKKTSNNVVQTSQ